MSLDDMAFNMRFSENRLSNFVSKSSFNKIGKLRCGTIKSVFKGKDMLPGLGLSLLLDMRKCLSPDERERLYQLATSDEIDLCVNTFYRPEIRLPKQFSTAKTTIIPGEKIYEFLDL